jgi:hypothetical protein
MMDKPFVLQFPISVFSIGTLFVSGTIAESSGIAWMEQ